jgi:hypothetical protein
MDGRFAYATGVTIDADGRPSLTDSRRVRFREMLPADEVDLGEGAALLTPEAVAALLPPASGETGPGPGREADAGGSDAGPGSTGRPGQPASGQDIGLVPPTLPGERAASLVLRAAVGAPGLFGLQRALAWIREHSSGVEVEVTVRATGSGEGFDPVALRNGVLEPLEEAGGNPEVELQ